VVFAGRNTHIAVINTKGLADIEAEANCDLIAAAPDLLEALQYLAMQTSVLAPDDAEHPIHSNLASARAAIAKATGGAKC
jgi:hypothetical protein